jgi:hypothetical protein
MGFASGHAHRQLEFELSLTSAGSGPSQQERVAVFGRRLYLELNRLSGMYCPHSITASGFTKQFEQNAVN